MGRSQGSFSGYGKLMQPAYHHAKEQKADLLQLDLKRFHDRVIRRSYGLSDFRG